MITERVTDHVKAELDLELDRQLEETFPASDAVKITRKARPTGLTSENDQSAPSKDTLQPKPIAGSR